MECLKCWKPFNIFEIHRIWDGPGRTYHPFGLQRSQLTTLEIHGGLDFRDLNRRPWKYREVLNFIHAQVLALLWSIIILIIVHWADCTALNLNIYIWLRWLFTMELRRMRYFRDRNNFHILILEFLLYLP